VNQVLIRSSTGEIYSICVIDGKKVMKFFEKGEDQVY